MILERAIQKLAPGKYEAYKAGEKKWSDFETRVGGFPKKVHYNLNSGAMPVGTIVWQREWPDFATAEAAYMKMFNHPEISEHLNNMEIVVEEMREYYFVEDY